MINLVLCWHMHQPDYRHHGEYLRPWTWLHAIKDYSDMAAHLENVPGARAVVNFSPVLMLQLQDISDRLHASLDFGMPVGDVILDALAGRLPADASRHSLLRSLLRANASTMIPRYQPYARLHQQARQALAEDRQLEEQDLYDLLVWYVTLWLGESLRSDARVARIEQLQRQFSAADRVALLRLVAETVGGILPRYRQLAEAGKIELSVTPFSHPILPLLIDMDAGAEAMPGVALPMGHYPGGRARCDWQMAQAISLFKKVFGACPSGCWPSEGGLSDATTRLLGRQGFRWTASGTRVLANSLGQDDGLAHLGAWALTGGAPDSADDGQEVAAPVTAPVTMFFRDDQLSDRIGFEYSRWDAAAAVDDFISQVEQRLDAWQATGRSAGNPVLSMIMDGENAWEYFPENGWAFLDGLYRKLAAHPRIRLTTYSDLLPELQPHELPALVAGSWVYGTFSTWIGDPSKNRAWDLLIQAKRAVDATLEPVMAAAASGTPVPAWVEPVLRQLSVCEASDWFWWLGEDNQLEDGPAFDSLYRQQLAGLYELLGMQPPAVLDHPINSAASGSPSLQPGGQGIAGAMRAAGEVTA